MQDNKVRLHKTDDSSKSKFKAAFPNMLRSFHKGILITLPEQKEDLEVFLLNCNNTEIKKAIGTALQVIFEK